VPTYDHCCKVGRVADKYDLSSGVAGTDINQGLGERWLGRDGHPERGLRPLLDWFQRKILTAVYIEHGRSTAEHRLTADYDALRSDDDDVRRAALDDLAADGIDGGTLLDDFVSTATLYRHLTNCLDLEKQPAETGSDWEGEKVEYVGQLVDDYLADALESWENSGDLPLATEADLSVNVYLECPVCLKQTEIDRARRRGYICEEHMAGDDDESVGEP